MHPTVTCGAFTTIEASSRASLICWATILIPATTCTPRRFFLQPNGALALQDRNNQSLWSSQSACLCSPGCYYYRITDAGEVVVYDGADMVTWTSSRPFGDLPPAPAPRLQLMSGMTGLGSCLLRDQSLLSAPDGATTLQLPSSPGQLQLVGPSGVVWTPPGVPAGNLGDRACIGADGTLRLLYIDGTKLWSSVAVSGAKGPYVVMLSNTAAGGGQLEIRDVACTVRWSVPSGAAGPSGNTGSSAGSPTINQRRPPPRNSSASLVQVPAKKPPQVVRYRTQPPRGKPAARGTPLQRLPPSGAAGSGPRRQQPARAAVARSALPPAAPPRRPQPRKVAAAPATSSAAGVQAGGSSSPCAYGSEPPLPAGSLCGGINLCGRTPPAAAAPRAWPAAGPASTCGPAARSELTDRVLSSTSSGTAARCGCSCCPIVRGLMWRLPAPLTTVHHACSSSWCR